MTLESRKKSKNHSIMMALIFIYSRIISKFSWEVPRGGCLGHGMTWQRQRQRWRQRCERMKDPRQDEATGEDDGSREQDP